MGCTVIRLLPGLAVLASLVISATAIADPAMRGGRLATPAVILAQPDQRLVLKAIRSVWVRVERADRTAVFARVMQAGEKVSVDAAAGWSILTRDAGSLVLAGGRSTHSALGADGEVLLGLPLSEAAARVARPQSPKSPDR
jgi:hypothetical protein